MRTRRQKTWKHFLLIASEEMYEELQPGKSDIFWCIREIQRNYKNRIRGHMGKYVTLRKSPNSFCKWKTCFTNLLEPSKSISKQVCKRSPLWSPGLPSGICARIKVCFNIFINSLEKWRRWIVSWLKLLVVDLGCWKDQNNWKIAIN